MIQGSSLTEKMLGSKQRYYHGSGVVSAEAGYQIWGIQINNDATRISTLTENPNIAGASQTAVTGYTFEGVDTLKAGAFILFDIPVVSFTLVNAADDVYYYIEPILGYSEIHPTVLTASVENAHPDRIILTFTDPSDFHDLVESPAPATSAFTLSGGKTVSSVSISENVVTIIANSAYANGNTITIGYTKPTTNYLRNAITGGSVVTFTNQSVTNNISA